VLEEHECGEGGATTELDLVSLCAMRKRRLKLTSTTLSTRLSSSMSFLGPRSSTNRARSIAPSQLLKPPSYTFCSMSISPSPISLPSES
jgi:hypothetical protein